MTEKYYQIGTHTPEQWYEIHNQLISSEGTESVPGRCVTCVDEKPHSPTRGIFLLTDEEAEALKADPRIKWINIDFTSYPEQFKPDPEELHATSAELLTRWQGNVKVYREFETSNTLPVTPDGTDINRTGFQLLRPMQKLDPWVDQSQTADYVFSSNVQQFGDARGVDVIVADDGGGWIGHPEFQNNCAGAKPTDYVGGNVLPGNGTCDILDLILDAPYYLDPTYFNADPANRLTTRWDGTTVPVESFARNWWTSTGNRSSRFNTAYPSAGTIPSITSFYTRAYCNGSNTTQSSVGQHCTPCMALTYGRTQGWAYNANKWVLNHYGTNGADIEPGFDLQKIFHQTKPINPKYGTKNPTVSSNSWGYRSSTKGGSFYHFRTDNPVAYGGTGDEPAFISHMGLTGDSGRWKSEFKPNSLLTALDELCDSGVIFVAAAGNSNQKQVKWDHPDYNNYISATADQALEDTTFTDIGQSVYGTTNRRGFPQQGGKVVLDVETGEIEHKTINIGALDDDLSGGGLERKVNYSDRGNDIDFYMPADGTLAANRSYTPEGRYPDTYPGFTADSGSGAGVPEDCAFGGTSAACPVAAGFIACLMGLNRNWTYREVRNYFQSLDVQSSEDFYYGVESTTATSANWTDYNSLEGGDARVGYQDISKITQTTFPIRRASIDGALSLNNLKINYKDRFDRG
jgi:hypothetical protein